MAEIIPHPAALPPMPAVWRILLRYDREMLEAFVTVAIDLIDLMDPHPDSEATGDEDEDGDPAGGNITDDPHDDDDPAG